MYPPYESFMPYVHTVSRKMYPSTETPLQSMKHSQTTDNAHTKQTIVADAGVPDDVSSVHNGIYRSVSEDIEVERLKDKISEKVSKSEGCTLSHSASKTLLSTLVSKQNIISKLEVTIAEWQVEINRLQRRLDDQVEKQHDLRQENLELQQKNLKLEQEIHELQEKVKDAEKKLRLERMKLTEEEKLSADDKHFYRIYEAEANRQQDCCKLCNVTEEHCDPSCVVCGHQRSHHGDRLKCSSCSCSGFIKGKGGVCSRLDCSHLKESHLTRRCERCDNCSGYLKHTIAKSHAYPRAVLIKKCTSNSVHSIFDGRRGETMCASSCKWYLLCTKCEIMFSSKERSFADMFDHQSYGDYQDKEGMIRQIDADVLLINTFRALPQSVRFGRFQDCRCEGHKCQEVYCKFQSWIIRTKKKLLTPTRCTQEFVSLANAGVQLFNFNASFPEAHLVEFPIICDVTVHGQSYSVIYAQIPPFYWAFSLDDEATTITRLGPHFPRLVDVMNTELSRKREEFFSVEGSSAHTWDVDSRRWQKKIHDQREEWEQKHLKLTEMKKASLDTPQCRKEVECRKDDEEKMYKQLLKVRDEHVPRDKLALVFAYLSDHCLSVSVDGPIFYT